MSISAVGSALSGISANQAVFDSAAARVARVETAPDDGSAGLDPTTAGRVALPPGSGELIDVVVGAMVAADGVAANTAMLRTALDMDRAVLDVLA